MLLVSLLIAAGVWWASRPKPVAVVLKEIERGLVESTIANTRAGTVEACQRTRLSTITGGRIEVLAVKEGDRVSKGQLLMKLWNDDQQAQSALAIAQATTARHHISEACAVAANAEREAERQSALRAKGFVSTAREDSARSEAIARRAGCEAARADLAQAEAKVRLTRVEQGRTVLYAPFAGTIAKIVGEVGEYSTPSPPGVPTPPAIDLIDDSCLYVKAPMDEVDAPRISAGQPVRISLDALPRQSFPGRVRRVAPYVSAVEKQARTVDIEATLDDPSAPGRLLVGYSADVEVILAVREQTVRVPTPALLEGGRVLVAGADGSLEERRVKTGLANWEYTEVLEGLTTGERVVTSLERAGVKAGAHYSVESQPAAAGK
ncbi:MAG: Macrolide-specific efflux protein MacA precursor [Candidatus Accumulibacter phosphatis]|uniref:Macrolide-specific efflux protein MacA n=1 Tax=Candidatus Accumulibacter phosphatis TaxID=327160 RepID=A0A080M0G4_9PROT|nr:efflux RND transporter periplasmic adaptor subunit [Accumulibacter sp.]KFB73830.1 MAG: Macrolide-specific efflux protein MacA precursor [Candidatus Accumulibacter phosphatis]HRF12725.1 efflux RND transporter periplasmic adaptor subunit [Candidatus Accumulibacter phosphatis]